MKNKLKFAMVEGVVYAKATRMYKVKKQECLSGWGRLQGLWRENDPHV
jgi:hypothetical protein